MAAGRTTVGTTSSPNRVANATTSLPVEHLFTMHLELTNPVVMADGPNGGRVFMGILAGTVSGPRVNGAVMPLISSAWGTLRDDSYALMHSSLVIETDDHARIAITSTGIAHYGPDPYRRVSALFEVGHDRYQWLNNVQGIAIGTPGRNEITYEVYALA